MPVINPKKAGDIFYPQFVNQTTHPIGAGVNIRKGRLYTKNVAGYLIVPTGALDWFKYGLYQARANVPAALNVADGDNTVQCLGVGSRIGILIGGTLPSGAKLKYDGDNDGEVDLLTFSAPPTASELYNHIGYMYEIYTKSSATQPKRVSEDGDTVVAELTA